MKPTQENALKLERDAWLARRPKRKPKAPARPKADKLQASRLFMSLGGKKS